MPVSLGPSSEPIPGYRLIERLGRGGFGEVWKAEAPGGLHKAIKFVYGDLDATENGEPADQEYKALQRIISIRHPYILSLERIDVVDGQLLIVMELADRNLWDRFRDCRAKGLPGIPRDELLGYMKEAAEALDLMNFEHQLQHLDIKPQNLFLVYNHVKIADFGLVKAFEGKRGTITGGVTPVYAAPETFEGWVSRHSDQYSLGIVFQELLTGQRPFNGTTARQLLLQHLQAAPDLSSLPEADREIVARSLAKKPDDRFAKSTDFVRALMSAGTAPAKTIALVPAIPPTTEPVARTPGASVTPAATPARFVTEPLGNIPPPANLKAAATQARLQTPLTEANANLEVLSLPAFPSGGEIVDQTGVLVPTLIIGLGGVANQVLTYFRANVRRQFGTDPLPHLRILAVDTDPNAIRALTQDRKNSLRADEIFHTSLNRASHYLKGDGPAGLDTWLGSSTLYQLPKNPGAAEIRAFGRLALMDHAATLARRVRAEIDASRQPSSLATANERTQLGIRSLRPRVFIVAGLGGGTGGGMFLDVGYLAKAVMRQLGDVRPEVIGVGLLPPANDASGKSTQALAQTHATLIELLHYCSESTYYDTKFGDANRSVGDNEPPFTRLALFPMADDEKTAAAEQHLQVVGRWLTQETLSYVGRVAELLRSEHDGTVHRLTTITGGEFRFEYPRDELCACVGRKLGLRLLRGWLNRSDPSKSAVAIPEVAADCWKEKRMTPDELAQRVHEFLSGKIGGPPTDLVEQEITKLLNAMGQGESLKASDAMAAVQHMIGMVGAPENYALETNSPGRVVEAWDKGQGELIREVERAISEIIVQMVERPGVRLAGAEEAIRWIESEVKKSLTTYEALASSLNVEANEISRKLFQMISHLERFALTHRRREQFSRHLLEQLRELTKKLHQRHLARMLQQIYRGVYSSIPEYLREVQYCRERLLQTEQHLAAADEKDTAMTTAHAGLNLLPFDAANLQECAERTLEHLLAHGLLEYDQLVQTEIIHHFESLLGFCLNSGPRAEQLAEVLCSAGSVYAAQRVPDNDAVGTLLQRDVESGEFADLVNDAVAAAHPPLAGPTAAVEHLVTIVGVPENQSGQELCTRLEMTKTRSPLHLAAHRHGVVIYRELQNLRITDLPHWKTIGQERYQQAIREQHLLPHSRIDVQWQPVTA
jgi:hypothetical protein